MKETVASVYAVTGAPRLPARWALGPWIWRDENKDQPQVEDDLERIRSLDLATTGVWIDHPYSSEIGAFDFDPARYTDAGGMIAKARSLGLRAALWHVPYLDEQAAGTASIYRPLAASPAPSIAAIARQAFSARIMRPPMSGDGWRASRRSGSA